MKTLARWPPQLQPPTPPQSAFPARWDDFYTYTLGKSNLNGTKVPLGKLYLDPVDFSGSSTLKLYFQSPTSGVYSNREENPNGGGTTWGAFTLK
jgi:hypothetical protein